MNISEKKKKVAAAALIHVQEDALIGIGSGSTVNFFIEELAGMRNRIKGAVPSSLQSEALLKKHGIPITQLNDANEIPVYIDGADEANRHRQLIKGGGAALTREKIIASISGKFVCIIDDSKLVKMLGTFPLPVEVIPFARSAVARRLAALGGTVHWRQGTLTDNGNDILDIHHLKIQKPMDLERQINDIPGVVCNGLFALRPADLLLVATNNGIETLS
ncbi:MAG: ribose-5-phosphate isomerase RpiA [Candidatus Eutrophobiaceae bacterium]